MGYSVERHLELCGLLRAGEHEIAARVVHREVVDEQTRLQHRRNVGQSASKR